jgi:hypothetical protein
MSFLESRAQHEPTQPTRNRKLGGYVRTCQASHAACALFLPRWSRILNAVRSHSVARVRRVPAGAAHLPAGAASATATSARGCGGRHVCTFGRWVRGRRTRTLGYACYTGLWHTGIQGGNGAHGRPGVCAGSRALESIELPSWNSTLSHHLSIRSPAVPAAQFIPSPHRRQLQRQWSCVRET